MQYCNQHAYVHNYINQYMHLHRYVNTVCEITYGFSADILSGQK